MPPMHIMINVMLLEIRIGGIQVRLQEAHISCPMGSFKLAS